MWRLAIFGLLLTALLDGAGPTRIVVVSPYASEIRDAVPEFEKQFGSGLIDLRAGANLDCGEAEGAAVIYIHGPTWTPQTQACEAEVQSLLQRGLRLGGTIPAVAQIEANWHVRPSPDLEDAASYLRFGGAENLVQFLAVLYNASAPPSKLKIAAPKVQAEAGIYHPSAPSIFLAFSEYLKWYQASGLIPPDAPLVGITFFQSNVFYGDLAHIDALIAALERRGIGAVPAFGWPLRADERFLVENGKPAVDLLFCLNLLMPSPDNADFLASNGLHSINLLTTTASYNDWAKALHGLPPGRTALQLGTPERTGATEPILIATTQKQEDGKSVLVPIPERIEAAAARAERWLALRHRPNSDKRIALIYFNNPPGKAVLGASYLNLFPSLVNILAAVKKEGYSVSDNLPDEQSLKKLLLLSGRNVGEYAPGELEALVRQGHATLLPVDTYERWYRALPPEFRAATEKVWGEPRKSTLMTVRQQGKLFFVIPGVRLGNIFLGPQPMRDSLAAAAAVEHSTVRPAPHSYVAFYLWLQYAFGVDAMVHLGRHGTLEWLPGKDVAQSGNDPAEILVGDVPNLYYYLVDGGGEFLQAQRRSQAVIISHLTPLLAEAGVNPEYSNLQKLIEARRQLSENDSELNEQYAKDIFAEARKLRLFEKLGIAKESPGALSNIEEFVGEQAEQAIPLGMHTIGSMPPEPVVREALRQFLRSSFSGNDAKLASPYVAQWAENLLDGRPIVQGSDLFAKVQNEAESWLENLRASPDGEIASLMNALSGLGLRTGVSGDPLRSPDALPTGRNMHDIDPRNFPTKAAWEVGKRMANSLLDQYRKEHGKPLEKASFVLWYGESNRHQGITEAQVLYLLGVEPVWNGRGQVQDVKLIPALELGRPRVDVVLTMSGLYRDGLPEKLQLFDRAAKLAAAAEDDNVVRRDTAAVEQRLLAQGVPAEQARKAALARIFGPSPETFGPGLAAMMEASLDGNDRSKVAQQYLSNMNYAYSDTLAGESVPGNLSAQLSDNQVVIHSRSTNLYGVLDNDETYQFAGGLNAATALSAGQSPEFLISNVRASGNERFETFRKFLARELDSRALNPKWIRGMQAAGYSGAQEFAKETEHLYGLRATSPNQVDPGVWQQMLDVYVKDKYGLGMRKFFEKENPHAQQMLAARLLEIDRQGIYNFSSDDKKRLLRQFIESVNRFGVSCYVNACANQKLRSFVVTSARHLKAVAPESLERWQQTVASADGKHPAPTVPPRTKEKSPAFASLLDKVRIVSREEFENRFSKVRWDWGWSWMIWFAALTVFLGAFYPYFARRRSFWSYDAAAFSRMIRSDSCDPMQN